MKITFRMKVIVTAMILMAFGAQPICAQGIEFFEGSFEEAKIEAQKQNKLIFVDAYAVWCGPCKRMAKNVFPLPEVGAFYNEHFINMKIDAEKGLGRNFAREYKVTAYPTLFFINGQGNAVHRVLGGRNPDALIKEGKKALNGGAGMLQILEEKYNAGERDADLLFKYVNALDNDGKSAHLAFGEYLATQSAEEKVQPKNIELIFNLTKDVVSPGYIYLMQFEEQFVAQKTLKAYQDKIIEISGNTTRIAAEDTDKEMFKNAQNLLQEKQVPEHTKWMLVDAVQYYELTEDWKNFAKQASKYVKTYAVNDDKELNKFAWKFYEQLDGKKYDKKALKWSASAVALNDNYRNNNTYAHLLFKTGNFDLAKLTAEKAVELGKKERINYRKTQDLLRSIKAETKTPDQT